MQHNPNTWSHFNEARDSVPMIKRSLSGDFDALFLGKPWGGAALGVYVVQKLA